MPELDNPFWSFSVSLYAAPSVADECLALQDAFGLDVNMLLFCAWAGSAHGIVLRDPDFRALDDIIRDWQETVVKPLRTVRRGLKPLAGNDTEVADLRAEVMRSELKAERIEQGLLHAMVHRLPGKQAEPAEAVRKNIAGLIAWHIAENSVALHETRAIDCPHLVSAAIGSA